MSPSAETPAWVELLSAAFLLTGAAITFIGALGLLRLGSFYERVHSPTLGTTLGTACIALASIIYFSGAQTRPVLHELLVVAFVLVTTPCSLMILVRAALFRDRVERAPGVPGPVPEPALTKGSTERRHEL